MRKKCLELIKELQFIAFTNRYFSSCEMQVLRLSVSMAVLIFHKL